MNSSVFQRGVRYLDRLFALLVFVSGIWSFAAAAHAEDPTTGELIAGSGYEKIRFKNVDLSPGGFFEATGIYRSANENADTGSTFQGVPINGTANSRLSEFRGTARQTRVSLLAESAFNTTKISGYIETDFLGAATTANETESNSWNLRIRQLWSNTLFSNGFSIMLGQGWSLLTTNRTGLAPRTEFIPLTIESQYMVGYNWARQWELRLTQDYGHGILAAISLENPETSTAGVVLPSVGGAPPEGLEGSNNALGPTSLINAGTVSANIAPDVLAKAVLEPGWGHWEVKALGRAFRDRLATNGTHISFGGGVGLGALLPVLPNLTLVAEGLTGAGIGRYGSGQGPDIMVRSDGTIRPIQADQFLVGLEFHPTSAWDVYTYYGLEYYARTFSGSSGYGAPSAVVNGVCNAPNTTTFTGVCVGNRTLSQIQPGFWYRFFDGKQGKAAVGGSYSWVERQLWSGAGGANLAGRDNIVMASFRFYLP